MFFFKPRSLAHLVLLKFPVQRKCCREQKLGAVTEAVSRICEVQLTLNESRRFHMSNRHFQKAMPSIQKFMTPMPHSIGADIPIKIAYEMMKEHRIRHLPVQKAGALVGVLTDRDIKLASSFQGPGVLKVDDVMTPDPYVVSPETPVDQVALRMSENRYGCAIVVQDNQKVVGIFTATDGMRVLGEVLDLNYRPREGTL